MSEEPLICASVGCAAAATHWDGTMGNQGQRCDKHRGNDHVPLNEYDRYYWRYKLITRCEQPEVVAYTLAPAHRDPSERAQTTEVAVIRGQILIFGDWCPSPGKGHNGGVISHVRGDALFWFCGRRMPSSGRYLAEKFLEQVWSDELALDWIRERLASESDPWAKARFGELLEDAEWRAGDGGELETWFAGAAEDEESPISSDDLNVGYGYVPAAVAHLLAIQRRFRALWWARATTTVADEEQGGDR